MLLLNYVRTEKQALYICVYIYIYIYIYIYRGRLCTTPRLITDGITTLYSLRDTSNIGQCTNW